MKSHRKTALLRSSSFLLAALFIFFFMSLLLVILEVQKSQTALSRAQTGGTCTVSGSKQALDPEEQKFIQILNEYREQNNLDPVTEDATLSKAAAWMANDMATKNYFDHTDSMTRSFEDRLEDCGYDSSGGTKENIANTFDTAEKVMEGWKNSAEHDAAMKDPDMTAVGIGRDFVKPAKFQWYWTLVLGVEGGGEQSQTTDKSPGGGSGDDGKKAARGGGNSAKKSSSKKSSSTQKKKAAKASGKKSAKKDDKGKKGKDNKKDNGKKNNKKDNKKKNKKKDNRKKRKRQARNNPTSTPTLTPGAGGTTVTPGAPNGETPVVTPSGTMLTFTVTLVGIGQSGNPRPISTERDAEVSVVDFSGTEVSNTLDILTFNARGQYAGTIDVGDVPDGTYTVKIMFDNTLRKNIVPEFQQITAKGINTMPAITLNQGDLDGNNQIDLADFNVFMACFETDCDDPFSDLNDDGIVNALDFNLMRENFSSLRGS